jgi:hypothetical protein
MIFGGGGNVGRASSKEGEAADAGGGLWEGDAEDCNSNKEEYARHASRFYGRDPPSASSAVVQTVYRKPREFADVHEYDEDPAIDRVPTAVGFHSMDSLQDVQEARSRHSRYEAEDERVEKQPERVATEGSERELPEMDADEPRSVDSTDFDQGRYCAEENNNIIDEALYSTDSDSCPAMWRSCSEENEMFKERDYATAVEQAKRLKALNEVVREVRMSAPSQQESLEPSRHSDEDQDENDDYLIVRGSHPSDNQGNSDGFHIVGLSDHADYEEALKEVASDGEDLKYRASIDSAPSEEASAAKHRGQWTMFRSRWIRTMSVLKTDRKDRDVKRKNRRAQLAFARAQRSKQRKAVSQARSRKPGRRGSGVASKAATTESQPRALAMLLLSDRRKSGPVDLDELDDLPLAETLTSVNAMDVQKSNSGGKKSPTEPRATQFISNSDSKSKQSNLASTSSESSDSKSKRSKNTAAKSTTSNKSKEKPADAITKGSISQDKSQDKSLSRSMKSGDASQLSGSSRFDNDRTKATTSLDSSGPSPNQNAQESRSNKPNSLPVEEALHAPKYKGSFDKHEISKKSRSGGSVKSSTNLPDVSKSRSRSPASRQSATQNDQESQFRSTKSSTHHAAAVKDASPSRERGSKNDSSQKSGSRCSAEVVSNDPNESKRQTRPLAAGSPQYPAALADSNSLGHVSTGRTSQHGSLQGRTAAGTETSGPPRQGSRVDRMGAVRSIWNPTGELQSPDRKSVGLRNRTDPSRGILSRRTTK